MLSKVRPQHLKADSLSWGSKACPKLWELSQKSLPGLIKQDRIGSIPTVKRYILQLPVFDLKHHNRAMKLLPPLRNHFLKNSRLFPLQMLTQKSRESGKDHSSLTILSSSTFDHSWGQDTRLHRPLLRLSVNKAQQELFCPWFASQALGVNNEISCIGIYLCFPTSLLFLHS